MPTAGGLRALPTGLLVRTGSRIRGQLERGEWLPTEDDRSAAEAVLAQLNAAVKIPAGRHEAETRQLARRLQRALRTVIHQVDNCPISPLMTEVLTGIAQSLVPWHGSPNPPPAAAAPAYGRSFWSTGAAGEQGRMAVVGEALRPHLVGLLQEIEKAGQVGSPPFTPPVEAWSVHHEGRLVRYQRSPGVWTATPVRCPACGRLGPWSVMSDWRVLELTCCCGESLIDHGLSLIGVCLSDRILETLQSRSSAVS